MLKWRSLSFRGVVITLLLLLNHFLLPTIKFGQQSERSSEFNSAQSTHTVWQTDSLSRPLRVGFYENPPKLFTNADGNIEGFWPDLIMFIAAKEGWEYEWVHGTWEENLARLESGQLDIMPDVAWSEPRSEIFAFSTGKVLISWSRLYTQPGTNINTVLDLEGKAVAGLAGSVNYDGPEGIKDIANRFDVNTTFVDLNDYTEVFEAIQNGTVDAGVTNRDFGNRNETNYNVERTPFIFQPAHIEFAFPEDGEFTPLLQERIDAHIEELKADEGSLYYQSLETYLEEEAAVTFVEIIPDWVKNLSLWGGGTLLFLLAVGIVSRVQVRRRTAALRKSEEKYRTLFDHATAGIFIANQAGHYVDVNRQSCAMLGYTRQELLNMKINDLVAPEDLDTSPLRMDDLLTGKSIISERKLLHKNGTRVLVEISSSLMPDGNLQGIVRDISEHIRSEQALQEQLDWNELLLKTMLDGYILADTEGKIIDVNPSYCALIGYSRDELLAMRIQQIDAQLSSAEVDERIEKIVAERGARFETKHRAKDGHLVELEVSIATLQNAEEIPLVSAFVRDITERKRAEKEREQLSAQIQQQERLASLGQLAAGIAHDFNNIMAIIILYSQMLTKSESLTERERERLLTINEQAWHASRLIEQVLDFSRQAVLERHPIDLLPLLNEQIKLLKRTLPEHIKVELHCPSQAYTVKADPTRMQQIITNLAVNARDAMPEGGTLRLELDKIAVQSGQTISVPDMMPGDWIRLKAIDSGIGIPFDMLPRIFEPFFTTKGPGQGSGLGLAQVHGIVGQHGGHITIDTQPGEGTTFTIYLPAVNLDPIEQFVTNIDSYTRGQGELILVVEDEAALRTALVASLEELNYRTVEAANGQEALAKMTELGEQIDLVLSDVIMPEMGGKALFHAIKDKGWQTPIILLTGHPMDTQFIELQSQGLIAWLPKPPNLERLTQTLAAALAQ